MTINLDDLTLGQIKELGKLCNNTSITKESSLNLMVGEKVIVRTYSAGVFFGTIEQKSGNEIILKDARRLNYFKTIKSISLSSIALYGVHKDSRIAPAVDKIWLEPIELITMSSEAIKSLEGHVGE